MLGTTLYRRETGLRNNCKWSEAHLLKLVPDITDSFVNKISVFLFNGTW